MSRRARAAPAGGGSLAVRYVVVDADHHLAPGEIVWDHTGRITALRRARGEVLDAAVFPGLVDAHAHLEIDALPAVERRFVPWLQAVMAARAPAPATAASLPRRALTELVESPPRRPLAEIVESPQRRALAEIVAAGAAELIASGVTAVGDIDSSGLAAAALAATPLRGRSYRELTGFHLDAAGAAALLRERAPGTASPGLPTGWSPHAPYSVAPALFRAAAASRRPLAIHTAESPDEQRFLRRGDGPFRELLERLGRLPAGFRAPGVGAVAWLERLGVLRRRPQLVHCQELERGDLARIAAAGASIVVCPGTIAWFGRTPPPVPRWLRAGVPVALGTDSRASNTGLSLRDELRRAANAWPELRPRELLAMATVHGGTALALPGVGHLRRGGRADLVVAAALPTFAATLAAFVLGESPLLQTLIGGRAHGRDASSVRATPTAPTAAAQLAPAAAAEAPIETTIATPRRTRRSR